MSRANLWSPLLDFKANLRLHKRQGLSYQAMEELSLRQVERRYHCHGANTGLSKESLRLCSGNADAAVTA